MGRAGGPRRRNGLAHEHAGGHGRGRGRHRTYGDGGRPLTGKTVAQGAADAARPDPGLIREGGLREGPDPPDLGRGQDNGRDLQGRRVFGPDHRGPDDVRALHALQHDDRDGREVRDDRAGRHDVYLPREDRKASDASGLTRQGRALRAGHRHRCRRDGADGRLPVLTGQRAAAHRAPSEARQGGPGVSGLLHERSDRRPPGGRPDHEGPQGRAGVRFIVSPASTSIYKQALDEGLIATFTEAGGVFTNSSCSACFGGNMGILAPGEVCASSSNRNFPGRMGAKDAEIYLLSPAATVAAAIRGELADPREFL